VGQEGGQAADTFEELVHLSSGQQVGSRALVDVDDGSGCSELNLGSAGALGDENRVQARVQRGEVLVELLSCLVGLAARLSQFGGLAGLMVVGFEDGRHRGIDVLG
jgi:hypothetical protein